MYNILSIIDITLQLPNQTSYIGVPSRQFHSLSSAYDRAAIPLIYYLAGAAIAIVDSGSLTFDRADEMADSWEWESC